MKIGYRDDVSVDYAKALRNVKTLEELKKLLFKYRELAEDAKKIVDQMNEKEFKTFVKNRNKENLGVYAGDETTAIIMMPAKMFKIALMAIEFKVPFGCMYNRLKNDKKFDEV